MRNLGFNGVQFGPQGQTTAGNRSPYDGTVCSKNILSIALFELARGPRWQGLLAESLAEGAVRRKPVAGSNAERAAELHKTYGDALRAAYEAFAARRGSRAMRLLAEQFTDFRKRQKSWLERDALVEAGGPHPGEEAAVLTGRQGVSAELAAAIDRYAFYQFVLDRHHADLRRSAREHGLKLFGDLQIGTSARDTWALRSMYLTDYVMGAPPSRTNPMGQPWNYPVLDPEQYGTSPGAPGPALAFLQMRVDKMLSEFDGLRIDHPHGLVCPWVYRARAADPIQAVRNGARLFESPCSPDHPALARFAIPASDQLNPNVPRHADDWVLALAPAQIDRYSLAIDCIVSTARMHHIEPSDIVCEVLSTLPFPLQKVLTRHGLGRFRVTQKADMDDPNDVYRSENAAPEDWIMVGNHDTQPIWRLVETWQGEGTLEARAGYLAGRLMVDPFARHDFAQALAANPNATAQAMFADAFASRAEHVMIFFADLLGLKEVYNEPGVVKDENWSLRAPDDYEPFYFTKVRWGEAINFPLVLAMAIRARGAEVSKAHAALLRRLDAWASTLCPTAPAGQVAPAR